MTYQGRIQDLTGVKKGYQGVWRHYRSHLIKDGIKTFDLIALQHSRFFIALCVYATGAWEM